MTPSWPILSTEAPRLRFGVAGERNFSDEATRQWVRDRFDEVWHCAAAVVAKLSERQQAPVLRLATGMAVGADAIAIDSYRAARKQVPNIRHELLLVYPCAPEAFAARSESTALSGFTERRAALLRAANADTPDPDVAELILNGGMPRSDSKDVDAPSVPLDPVLLLREKRIRNAAHRYQSEALIRQCELLIAVFDRRKSGEAGGTRGTIELALQLQTPVLLLDPVTRHVFMLSCLDELAPEFVPPTVSDPALARTRDADGAWREAWAGTMAQLLTVPTPPTRSSGHSHTKADDPPDAEHQLREWVFAEPTAQLLRTPRWERFTAPFKERAEQYRKEQQARQDESGAHAAEDTAGTHLALPKCTAAGTFKLLLKAIWRWLLARPAKPEQRAASSLSEHWRDRIAQAQGHAMEAYRSVFLSNYLLGFSAVLLAVCAFAILAGTGLKPGPASLVALLLITVLKLAVVMRISHNTHRAEHHDYAGHAVGLRYLSERLRIMSTMLLAGSSRVDLLHQTPRRGAPHRVLEDICRRLPLSACAAKQDRYSALGSLRKLIDSQLGYHSSGLVRMQLLHQHLNHAVQLAGKAVIGIVIIDVVVLLLKIAHKLHAFDACLGLELAQQLGSALGWIGLVCVALTALLPALMATLNAIQFQSQAEQLAERHGAMGAALKVLKHEVEAQEKRLDNPGASLAVLALCERAAGLFAEEVAEWATMYRQGVKES